MQSTKQEDKFQPEESLEELREAILDLSNLLKSRGWDRLVNMLNRQCRVREQNVVYKPCKNMEAVFEQEYEKGEISGIYQAINLASVAIEDFKASVKTQEEKLPLEENDNE